VSDQLDEPNAVAFGDGTVYALQVRRGCTNILAEALPRLSLREPDLRDLRNREGDLGQDRRRPTSASGQQRITHRLERLPGCEVGKLRPAQDIARGIDVRHRRAKCRIDLDPS